jgi:ferredoxin
MKLEIDWTRCDGHGLCAALLPDRISLDEWGFPLLYDARSNADASSSEDARRGADTAQLRRAVGACPALALRLSPA